MPARILLLVNVGRQEYQGQLLGETAGSWQLLDPASGAIRAFPAEDQGHLPLTLAARQAVLPVRTGP